MREVGVLEAKTHLSALLEAVNKGEAITITRNGKAVGRLLPPQPERPPADAGFAERVRAFRERLEARDPPSFDLQAEIDGMRGRD